MSWFIGSLIVLWYAIVGHKGEQAQRHRPWYTQKPQPTFADMLAACRLHLWRHWLTADVLLTQTLRQNGTGRWNTGHCRVVHAPATVFHDLIR